MTWDGKLQFKSDKSKNRILSLNSKAKSAQSDVKVMIGIGGYGNSEHFASVVGNFEKMKVFINNIVTLLEEYNIDGVDFYWRSASEEDKWRYITFVRELRKSLTIRNREKPFLISLTIPAVISSYELAYDLEDSLKDVDFFNVFSMDYYGPWENQWGTPAGPIAPLYNTVPGKNGYCVDSTLNYYVCKTKQPSKFNIVIPFFARLWRHVKEAVKPEKEVIRNVELKDNKAVGDGYMFRWTVQDRKYKISPATWDEESKTSYIYNPVNETYLTFEDEKSINAKIEYVNSMNLGGVGLWTLNMDDDKSSVLNMVFSKELCSKKTQIYVKYHC
ncbi:hypothetical protein L5515_014486 [Caenorhabditis briggsae]|uniref:GH18 domain-containing protein n=3 Tax=Caenorhabditis briggsae TaxID=6238 RepID=A0AAE9J8P8_CAEBR|nr:hypothetical protein L5515_014486 [Caenorhabditis briggsae]